MYTFFRKKKHQKLFVPLHYDNSSIYSKIPYGDGNFEFIVKKILILFVSRFIQTNYKN